jgi:hypothetical protein
MSSRVQRRTDAEADAVDVNKYLVGLQPLTSFQ